MTLDQPTHPGLPPLPPYLQGPGRAVARMRFYNHWFEEHLLPPIYKPNHLALAKVMDVCAGVVNS
jgi:hypothetical protein